MFIIKNATIITWSQPNQILENGAVAIQADKIAAVGGTKNIIEQFPNAEQIDAQGALVMPGNICAHTHFYGAFARGMSIPGDAPSNFLEILNKLWWALDKSLSMDAVRYSALVCQLDAIRHGTTTLIDHHASPNALSGSLDVIQETVEQSGLRAVLCYEVTDRDGLDKADEGIHENVRFIKKVSSGAYPRIRATFGLHASLTLSDDTLEKARKNCPEEIGMHIHVAEDRADQMDSLEKCNMRVVNRLKQHGIINSKSILAHAVHIDDQEMEILSKSRAWVTHQPRSNMNNAVGLPQVEKMHEAGVRLALGNDGFSNAMWEEWKAAYLGHKLIQEDPRRMPADLIAEMAIENNAELTSHLYDQQIGKIEAGAQADLILVEYHPYTELTTGNIPWHIVFGFHESMITTTIVDGQILMKDRKIISLNEEVITQEALQLSKEIWKKYQGQF